MTKLPRILICDDDLGVLQSFKMILKGQGYKLSCVTNGARALAIIRNQKVDLLLLDILMPKLSGIEVAKQVAKLKPKLKIIIITSLLHHGLAIELYKYGVVDFIIKPPDRNRALKTIARALQKS
jgi:DNA-binding NtrC family response regulator